MKLQRCQTAESLAPSARSACLCPGFLGVPKPFAGCSGGPGAAVGRPVAIKCCFFVLLLSVTGGLLPALAVAVITLVTRCWMGPGMCLISCLKLIFPNRVDKQLHHKTRFFLTAGVLLCCVLKWERGEEEEHRGREILALQRAGWSSDTGSLRAR